MPVLVSLSALQHGTVRLLGELEPDELGLVIDDPCLALRSPIRYDLEAQMMGEEVFVEGIIETVLDCQCVRCLEPFQLPLVLNPWACLLPVKGEDAAPVVDDSVNLTPQMREDSLLALPQHPVCRPDCRGLPLMPPDVPPSSDPGPKGSSAWSALDGLKLE